MNKMRIKTKIMLLFATAAVMCAGGAITALSLVSSAKNADAEKSVFALNALFAELCAFAVSLPIILIIFGLILSGNISKPLKFLADAISGIAETGNIFLDDYAYRQSKVLNARKDEIGEISRSVGDMLAMFREKIKSLNAVAGGDLTVDITVRSKDDTVGKAMISMVGSLNGMFSDIRFASESVAEGSFRMDAEARALAGGAAEQADSVRALSVTVADVAGQTSQNAEMAARSAALSRSIKTLAEKGEEQMAEMTSAVNRINKSGDAISKVIKIIDDIAFRTNILALNAGVEAARAGQHGKGFAVVASEIRSLAAKSQSAASDTGELISDSVEKARLGSKIAVETALSFRKIVESITESADLADKIADLSDRQASIIADVNGSIDKINESVRKNSQTADESARDSREVSRQSAILRESIGKFKIIRFTV
ncbi:MAG: methyl-accepting chemotaxis protein [Oscillospiraceae bacterium]|nr:methyl-accepting chemotaxis protein [Oscillospiraceae bacterium]